MLSSYRLPYTSYETIGRFASQTSSVFQTWDSYIKEFTNAMHEVTRKWQENFIPIKVVPAHPLLM
jgi:hypothetical protein